MEKKRFKMYKAGKSWIVAPIVFFSLIGLGSIANTQQVNADEVSQSEISEFNQQTGIEESTIDTAQEEPRNQESIEIIQPIEDSTDKELDAGNENDQMVSEETTETENKSINDANLNENTNSEIVKETDSKEDTQIDEAQESSPIVENPVESTNDTKPVESVDSSQIKQKEGSSATSKTNENTAIKSSTETAPAKKVTTKKVSIPIYRVYNPNSGEHLHTMNGNEKNHLVRLGWRDEGISMYVDGTGNQLFRLYNPNSGEHFFTLNAKERDNLKRHGWRYEGVAWKTPVKGVPMYRVYNPNTRGAGAHHYTMDVNERNSLVKKGWRNEGISWYTLGGSKPLASYVLLNAPFIDQQAAGFPMGCEAASLLQALQLKGYAKNYNLKSFIKQQPKSPNNNPNNGFSGDPGNIVSGVYHSIFAKPLANWGSKYGKVSDVTGYSVEDLKNELRKGNPVVVYVTLNFEAPRYGNYWWGKGINNAHIMTLDGFNEANQTYHVSDPNGKKGGKYWVSASKFEASYNTRKSAVVVR